MASIFTASDENISLLSQLLLKGEIVAVPTETVYGLAAHAYNESACTRIFEAKQRPTFDPLIVHIATDFNLADIAEPNPLVKTLAQAYWPGPLTLVLQKKPSIPDIVTAGLNSVAVRMPDHPIFQRLLKACNGPLAAPSANPFGYVSPTSADHVNKSLGTRIAHILDGGPCEIGLESTILDIRVPTAPLLLRPGAISAEQLSETLQRPVGFLSDKLRTEIMPGQLKKHYSPRAKCHLRDRIALDQLSNTPDTAYLFYRKPSTSHRLPSNIFWLSETGNPFEASRSLFRVLRTIDEGLFSSLVAERAPGGGLAVAINDRLTRASAGREGKGPTT